MENNMVTFYKGTEIKFKIEIQALGFDMNEQDFDVEVISTRGSVSGSKKGHSADGRWGNKDLFISRTEEEIDGEKKYEWYVVADTTTLSVGNLIVKVTAYINDEMAYDGVRTDIAKETLGRLID